MVIYLEGLLALIGSLATAEMAQTVLVTFFIDASTMGWPGENTPAAGAWGTVLFQFVVRVSNDIISALSLLVAMG
ncbi:MAG: hypothetical protein Q6K80_10395 [Thermostichus sp. DG_1_6_bins_120]